MSAAQPFSAAFARLSTVGKINLIALVAAIAALSVQLWPAWRHNPDLSHGLFMPFLFLLLLHESRAHGTPRLLSEGKWLRLGIGLLLAAGLCALAAAGLYAAAVDWSHALVNLVLTTSVVCFLGAALLAFSTTSTGLFVFNWNSLVGIGLWLLCTPIPPGTYSRLTVALQLWVSENVLRALHLLGVAAIRHGNIIELANTTVGVEEACSGVRSLISCLFAGFFFSATLVRRPWARAAIVGLAAPLAIVMNFIRSLTLTLLSNNGIDISGAWHDATGFAVLGVTAAILGGLALLLDRGPKTAAVRPEQISLRHAKAPQWMLTGGLAIAAALVIVFVGNTRPSIRRDVPVPDLLALLPANVPGWHMKTSEDLFQFTDTLQTNHLAQRQYARPREGGPPIVITIYVAYWRAGQAPVSLVASHTPDACWPGAGWTVFRDAQMRVPLVTNGRTLADAEYRLFKAGDFPQHVWFWHLYDGRPIAYRDPYSASALLRLALQYGFRRDGDQLFVRVSSNRPWQEIAHEPLVAEFFSRTQALGL